jgi:hypothetical protein
MLGCNVEGSRAVAADDDRNLAELGRRRTE